MIGSGVFMIGFTFLMVMFDICLWGGRKTPRWFAVVGVLMFFGGLISVLAGFSYVLCVKLP